jgi:hypothetical protein
MQQFAFLICAANYMWRDRETPFCASVRDERARHPWRLSRLRRMELRYLGRMLTAPVSERLHDWAKRLALVGEIILGARRMLTVETSLDDLVFFQAL